MSEGSRRGSCHRLYESSLLKETMRCDSGECTFTVPAMAPSPQAFVTILPAVITSNFWPPRMRTDEGHDSLTRRTKQFDVGAVGEEVPTLADITT